MHDFNRKILLSGLAGLAVVNLVTLDSASNDKFSLKNPDAIYSTQQPEARTYSLTFVEREGLFEINSNGISNLVGGSDWIKPTAPNDVSQSGDADQVRRQYAQFRQGIPELRHLDRHLEDLANGMINNPSYLANNNEFGIEARKPDALGRTILNIRRHIKADNDLYWIYLTAHGRYAGEQIKIDNLGAYKISGKGELESRMDTRDTEMHYWYTHSEKEMVIRHRAEIRGESIHDLGLNGWEKMRQGILNQNLKISDLRPAPDFP